MPLGRRSKAARGNEFFPGFSDVAEIGIGSLSTVYRAREIGTNRLVALKLLNVRDASPRALESFERESVALGAVSPRTPTSSRCSARSAPSTAARCSCWNCATVRSPTGCATGRACRCRRSSGSGSRSPPRWRRRTGPQILHRDVKPQNILDHRVRRAGARGLRGRDAAGVHPDDGRACSTSPRCTRRPSCSRAAPRRPRPTSTSSRRRCTS